MRCCLKNSASAFVFAEFFMLLMNTNELAYLLGYQETNSFLFFFIVWTGKNICYYGKYIECNGDK